MSRPSGLLLQIAPAFFALLVAEPKARRVFYHLRLQLNAGNHVLRKLDANLTQLPSAEFAVVDRVCQSTPSGSESSVRGRHQIVMSLRAAVLVGGAA